MALAVLIAFPLLLLALYSGRPRSKPCPSACIAFIGDSVTANWPALRPPNRFSGLEVVNRGLAGDGTANMLLRFRRDVVELRPRIVVIAGGLNDLAHTPLPIIEQNLTVMSETARDRRIAVILATVPPARGSAQSPAAGGESPGSDLIAALNAWIRSFAAQNHYALADYYRALYDQGSVYEGALTADGVHPSAGGYARMEPVLREAVRSALE
ncbi:MAG TPA: GDSL-type esterase/lipase family protein [Candidatus Acidoferrum sp.]|nr:GDSL-type esterase/lipase family protein [Candidatus Acidoferrum sp.]